MNDHVISEDRLNTLIGAAWEGPVFFRVVEGADSIRIEPRTMPIGMWAIPVVLALIALAIRRRVAVWWGVAAVSAVCAVGALVMHLWFGAEARRGTWAVFTKGATPIVELPRMGKTFNAKNRPELHAVSGASDYELRWELHLVVINADGEFERYPLLPGHNEHYGKQISEACAIPLVISRKAGGESRPAKP